MKTAENVSGHEKVTDKYESLNHQKPKGSTAMWFIAYFAVYILFIVGGIISILSSFVGPAALAIGITTGLILILVGVVISLYVLWRAAELVSGHESVFEKYERLEHIKKKESTLKWFIIAIIPFVNLYFLWKLSEVVSGHDLTYQ